MVTSLSGRMFSATVRWAVFYTSSSASQSLRLSSARDLNARSTISLDDSSTADSISSSIHSRSLISLIGNSQLQVESHSLISTLIVYHPIRSLSSFFSSFFVSTASVWYPNLFRSPQQVWSPAPLNLSLWVPCGCRWSCGPPLWVAPRSLILYIPRRRGCRLTSLHNMFIHAGV